MHSDKGPHKNVVNHNPIKDLSHEQAAFSVRALIPTRLFSLSDLSTLLLKLKSTQLLLIQDLLLTKPQSHFNPEHVNFQFPSFCEQVSRENYPRVLYTLRQNVFEYVRVIHILNHRKQEDTLCERAVMSPPYLKSHNNTTEDTNEHTLLQVLFIPRWSFVGHDVKRSRRRFRKTEDRM